MNFRWLDKFPLHPFTVVCATLIFVVVGIVAAVRLALGLIFPDGYETFLVIVVSAMGVSGAIGIGRRMTDYQYQEIKNKGTPPVVSGGPTTVEVKPDV